MQAILKDVRTYKIDACRLYNQQDIARLLSIKSIPATTKEYDKDHKRVVKLSSHEGRKIVHTLTYLGVQRLLMNNNRRYSNELLAAFGIALVLEEPKVSQES